MQLDNLRSAEVVNTYNTVNNMQIGYAIYSTTGYYFKGEIDDVRILDDVLIEEQIAGIVAGTEWCTNFFYKELNESDLTCPG